MGKFIGIAALVFVLTAPALAQDERFYIDDRSSAVSVLMSYYNAINRHEYARAWSYWGEGHADQSYEQFVDGYAETASVSLFTGEELSEGAAGSVYHSVAVAIQATDRDGHAEIYAGCFTLRLAQPAIQEPPFEGLHIESADLKQVEGTAEQRVPETCVEDMGSEAE